MKSLIAILLLTSSSSGLVLDKLEDNQELLMELMNLEEGHHHPHHHSEHVHHHYHPTVKQITKKKLEKKLKKLDATPKAAIERKEEKIINEAIKEVEAIKEATSVPTPMSVPLAKAPAMPKVPGLPEAAGDAEGSGSSTTKSPVPVVVEDPMVPENKVVEVDKPESRTDVDNRSIVQKAFDRAEEKLTFKDWQDNQNQKEMKEYIKNPAKYTQSEDADEIADEKSEQKGKQKDADIKLQKKILKKTDKAIDKAEKQDLKQQKKDLFEQARDAPNEKEREIIIATAAKLIPTEAQTVKEALIKGKEKIGDAIYGTSFGEAFVKPIPQTPLPPVATAQISADEFEYSDYMWVS